MPTDAPTSQPKGNEENVGIRTMDKLKGVGCKFLGKMGFQRACGKTGKAVLPKVDAGKLEDELTKEFYVQDGARVSIVSSLKTLLRVDKNRRVVARAAKRGESTPFELINVGGGKLRFGSRIALKIGGKYVTSENGLLVAKSDRLTSRSYFTLLDPSDYGSRLPVRDFATVSLRTAKKTWVVADKTTAEMRSDGPGVGKLGRLQFMKLKDAAPAICSGESPSVDSPGYSRCKASSVWDNDPIGRSHGLGRLGSSQAWSARTNRKGEWWQIDAGSPTPIVGVRTQGRSGGSDNQRVTAYKVSTSTDGKSWSAVDGGKVFAANAARSDTTVVNKFSKPVRGRYVRIIVESWKHHVSMRAALDVCKVKSCKNPLKNQDLQCVDLKHYLRKSKGLIKNGGEKQSSLDSCKSWTGEGGKWVQDFKNDCGKKQGY